MAEVVRPSRASTDARSGRPSTYTDILAIEICERLACGESLRLICTEEEMPHRTTVIRWLSREVGFRDRYEIARRLQADTWRDEIYDLASAEPARDERGRIDAQAMRHRRNRIGTLQWLATKLTPKGHTQTST